MISIEQYRRVLDRGLLLDHYLVLCNLRDGIELPKNKRIDGFINLLYKKGYIDDGILTEKAYEVIDLQSVMIVQREPIETPKFDFGGWVASLHTKCQDKMIEVCGKKQMTAKINKTDRKGYPFMLNIHDFSKRVLDCIQRYKLKDMDLVERKILGHIENCGNSGNWFPLMKYYIYKQGEGSQLVTDMENGGDEISVNKSVQKFV